MVQPALLSVKNLHGCSEWRLHFAISIPKDKYDMREKRRDTKLFFQSLNNNYYFLCWFTSCLWNIYFGKNTAIISWPPCSRILSILSKCVLRDVIAQEWIPRIIKKPIDCACSWSYTWQILAFSCYCREYNTRQQINWWLLLQLF